jgi:hypothetical protein
VAKRKSPSAAHIPRRARALSPDLPGDILSVIRSVASLAFVLIGICTGSDPPYNTSMSRFWLTYNQSGRLRGVIILDSTSLTEARMRTSVDRTDLGCAFARGYRLAKEAADLVPAKAIGRMLDPAEVDELLTRLSSGSRRRRGPLVKLGRLAQSRR